MAGMEFLRVAAAAGVSFERIRAKTHRSRRCGGLSRMGGTGATNDSALDGPHGGVFAAVVLGALCDGAGWVGYWVCGGISD